LAIRPMFRLSGGGVGGRPMFRLSLNTAVLGPNTSVFRELMFS